MPQGYLSLAIWEPMPGKEAESLATFRELNGIVSAKGYGHDQLYLGSRSHYVLLRYWNSEEAQRTALEDADLLRCWARLGNEIRILQVYEKLEAVSLGENKV